MTGYLLLPPPRLQYTSANAKAQALVFDFHVVGQEKSWKKSDPISLEISQTQDLSIIDDIDNVHQVLGRHR